MNIFKDKKEIYFITTFTSSMFHKCEFMCKNNCISRLEGFKFLRRLLNVYPALEKNRSTIFVVGRMNRESMIATHFLYCSGRTAVPATCQFFCHPYALAKHPLRHQLQLQVKIGLFVCSATTFQTLNSTLLEDLTCSPRDDFPPVRVIVFEYLSIKEAIAIYTLQSLIQDDSK